jgi:hypothetical protein
LNLGTGIFIWVFVESGLARLAAEVVDFAPIFGFKLCSFLINVHAANGIFHHAQLTSSFAFL